MFIRAFSSLPRLSRGLATHANLNARIPAVLHLKTGESFVGRSFGARTSTYGETVFSTSITSCTFFLLSVALELRAYCFCQIRSQ